MTIVEKRFVRAVFDDTLHTACAGDRAAAIARVAEALSLPVETVAEIVDEAKEPS